MSRRADLIARVVTGESGGEFMQVWRSAGRRFPVWEDANECGFAIQKNVNAARRC